MCSLCIRSSYVVDGVWVLDYSASPPPFEVVSSTVAELFMIAIHHVKLRGTVPPSSSHRRSSAEPASNPSRFALNPTRVSSARASYQRGGPSCTQSQLNRASPLRVAPASQLSRQAFFELQAYFGSFSPILPDHLRCSFGFTKDQLVPKGSQIARVWERANLGIEVEVRAKASWRMTRSDRGKP
ncbi:hypothetical protein E5676_scaffold265G002800 [Cucumis melo var. makuwa]|uniref:Ty3-gypsy retrotransposon protein n=1 Tax=Cucumis melo var. makuwa TaxID=1194695 RepID=A0A5A7U3L1_CUCMM|nr:hypothetical protein E6C27_scaffold63G00370 [Cucumis melo var. makuwa]TYK08114.1 hypothetical protein E5676_scaffold265G002800 [Cucumis melo var. makuwa]